MHSLWSTGIVWAVAVAAGIHVPLDAAQPDETGNDLRSGVEVQFAAGGIHYLDTDVDGGGELGITRLHGSVDLRHRVESTLWLVHTLGYDFDNYDFMGTGKLARPGLWDQIHTFRVRSQALWECAEDWTVVLGPVLTLASENDSDQNDAWTAGGIVGVDRRFHETFSAGFGVAVFSRIEDDVTVFPFVRFDWQFAEDWSLRSGHFDLGSSGGAGLEVEWRFLPRWEAAVGGQYQTRRFRLDNDGIAPDGVGSEKVVPVYARVTCSCLEHLHATVFLGMASFGELELENKSGDRISKKRYDPAPLIGLRVGMSL